MKNKFWKIYGIITGIAVTACVAVLVVLWTFLASYEKSQPEHTAKDVTDMFYNLDIDSHCIYQTAGLCERQKLGGESVQLLYHYWL